MTDRHADTYKFATTKMTLLAIGPSALTFISYCTNTNALGSTNLLVGTYYGAFAATSFLKKYNSKTKPEVRDALNASKLFLFGSLMYSSNLIITKLFNGSIDLVGAAFNTTVALVAAHFAANITITTRSKFRQLNESLISRN